MSDSSDEQGRWARWWPVGKTHEAREWKEARPPGGRLVGSESQRSAWAGPLSLSPSAVSLCCTRSQGSEMGTAIYKLSGKINFRVKKTHIPGRFPWLLTLWRHPGHWEDHLNVGSVVCAFDVTEGPSWPSGLGIKASVGTAVWVSCHLSSFISQLTSKLYFLVDQCAFNCCLN